MVPKPETWTIVLRGLWNVRIFSPEWVAANLFNTAQIDMDVAIGPGTFQLRFRRQNITMVALEDAITISCNGATLDALVEAEAVAVRLLDLLSHTPVTAIGINFGFLEEYPSTTMLELFTLGDQDSLAEHPAEVERIDITRSIRLDRGVLNLKHSLVNDQVEISFNFHHDVATATAASAILRGRANACHQYALNLLTNAYSIPITEVTHETAH